MGFSTNQKIRMLRMFWGYTEYKMGRELGMSQQRYCYLESRQKNFSDELLEQIANIFKISKDDLVLLEPEECLGRLKDQAGLILSGGETGKPSDNWQKVIDVLKEEISVLHERINHQCDQINSLRRQNKILNQANQKQREIIKQQNMIILQQQQQLANSKNNGEIS